MTTAPSNPTWSAGLPPNAPTQSPMPPFDWTLFAVDVTIAAMSIVIVVLAFIVIRRRLRHLP